MATFTVPCPKAGSSSLARVGLAAQNLPRNASPNASLSFGFRGRRNMLSAIRKVQTKLNKVNSASSSNSVAVPSAKSVVVSPEERDESAKEIVEGNSVPDPESISAFMAQVSDFIKLVDSRDIVELQLKQSDCEVTIRKKEALEQPSLPQFQYAALPAHAMYAPPPPQAATTPAGPPALPASSSSGPPKATKPSHPPLKCPMAGTFYRSPAPGEPPFVKVGDKVQKGQVICIVEAMKLMNEIEADQSGTVVEILAEDGKPVSVDTALFVIAP